jgi:hypothetical protein
MRLALTVGGTAVLAGALVAQNSGVPRGQAIFSIIGNVAPSQGLWLAARPTTCTPVTGLVAAGAAGAGVNCVQLDPVDDRIWYGGINFAPDVSTAGQVNWIRIDSGTNTVTAFTQHGNIGNFVDAVHGIAFDDNGNPVCCFGNAAATSGVRTVSRNGGGVGVPLIGTPIAGGIHNAICRDPAGNLYHGLFLNGQIWKSVKNPDCTYAAPVMLGTVPVTPVAAMDWCPPNNLIIGTFGAAGNAIFRMADTGGAAVVLSPTARDTNSIDFDPRVGDLWTVTAGINPDSVNTMTKQGAETLVCQPQGGNVGSPAAARRWAGRPQRPHLGKDPERRAAGGDARGLDPVHQRLPRPVLPDRADPALAGVLIDPSPLRLRSGVRLRPRAEPSSRGRAVFARCRRTSVGAPRALPSVRAIASENTADPSSGRRRPLRLLLCPVARPDADAGTSPARDRRRILNVGHAGSITWHCRLH